MITSLISHAAAAISTGYKTGLPQTTTDSTNIDNILQIVIAILAALSVLMIVIAGFRFVAGQGNPQEVAKARSTIVYAIVGLLLAICAQAILTLALGKL